MKLLLAAAIAGAVALAVPTSALAEAYLRVIAQQATVHTGPSGSYRRVYVAERGEVFEVVERGTRGYWFRIALEDGTTGWIFGELVFPFEVVAEGKPGVVTRFGRWMRRTFLAPSPVPYADAEVSFSAGLLDGEGLYLLRPAWLLDPYFAIEAFAGISPRAQTDIFLGGLGWTLRMRPGSAFAPYIHVGIGAGHIRPKADNFIDPEETLMALSAGGGLEITFKKQITVRLDARNWTLFDPDQASNGLELSGGLAIFF